MTEKEAQQVLDEMQGVRPERLNGEAKRLFKAIMKIADERDELKKELKRKDKQIERYQNMLVTNDLLHIKESQEKNKIIDLMTERVLLTEEEWKEIQEKNIYNVIKKDTHELIKRYFENKAKEVGK